MKPLLLPTLLPTFLLGCVDYGFDGKDAEPAFDDGSDPDTELDVDTGDPPAVAEECNGVDDDGDGLVDEGFPDSDGDGTLDCLEAACTLDLPAGGPVATVDTCGDATPVDDPWNVQTKWEWDHLPSDPTLAYLGKNVVTGNLTDDNGDGDADADDIPEIVFTVADSPCEKGKHYLVALSGDDGHEQWVYADSFMDNEGAPAIGDVDGDGWPDVVAFTDDYTVIAVDHTGALLWESAPFAYMYFPMATLADLDGDGTVEVVLPGAILDGATGRLETTFGSSYTMFGSSAVADLDDDGALEVISVAGAWTPDGDNVWSAGLLSGLPALIDLDGNPSTGEVVWGSPDALVASSSTGRMLWLVQSPRMAYQDDWGAPTVADLDGDGSAEIVVTRKDGTINAYDKQGGLLWSVVHDASLASANPGIAAADLDDDGDYELVFSSQGGIHIYDGDGTELYGHPDTDGAVYYEYPAITDVDGDGSADIVAIRRWTSVDGPGGILRVYEHAAGAWPKTTTSWNQFDFTAGNVQPDGSVPSNPPPSWVGEELYRGWPSDAAESADLRVSIADVCAAACDSAGELDVSVQVQNAGLSDVAAGTPVSLYRVDADVRTWLATQDTPVAIPAGTSADAVFFRITAADFGGDGLVVVVDDDGRGHSEVRECVEDDNEATWSDPPCP